LGLVSNIKSGGPPKDEAARKERFNNILAVGSNLKDKAGIKDLFASMGAGGNEVSSVEGLEGCINALA